MKRTLIVTLFGVLLGLVGVSSAAAGAGEMSQTHAGNYYLNSVCPEYPAINRLDRALPTNSHGYWRTKDLTPRVFRRVKSASRNLSDVYFDAARRMYNPPKNWPSYVVTPVNKAAKLTRRSSNVTNDLGHAYTPRGFTRIWNNRFAPLWKPMHNVGNTIRAKLDLPPSPKGC
ncbi:MAG TPA: hypothetical protein VFI21_04955 [Nocardioides sp.]|nr:hypothetical protein [Nocardioides sp.]